MNLKLLAVAQLILKELDQIEGIEESDGINELYFIYNSLIINKLQIK